MNVYAVARRLKRRRFWVCALGLHVDSAGAAAIIGWSDRRADILRDDGTAPAYTRDGDAITYKIADVIAWVQARKIGEQSAREAARPWR